MKTKLMTMVLIAGMFGVASAHAHFKVAGVADSKSPLGTMTPMNFSDSTYIYNRLAVLNGSEAAAGVLNGEQMSDQFMAAATSAQLLLGKEFKSPLEAATAILDLAEQLREK